jgi:ABC-type lipoprotein export system ATPase subunit
LVGHPNLKTSYIIPASVDEHGDLSAYLEKEFLGNEKGSVLLIIGEGGSGKTTFLQMFGKHKWQKLTNKSWIPLYIPLYDIKTYKMNLISHYLNNKILSFTRLQKAYTTTEYCF